MTMKTEIEEMMKKDQKDSEEEKEEEIKVIEEFEEEKIISDKDEEGDESLDEEIMHEEWEVSEFLEPYVREEEKPDSCEEEEEP